MILQWKKSQNSASLCANTVFGVYRITAKNGETTTLKIDVNLEPTVDIMSFHGEHETISAAEKAAQADYDYRQHMWETL